MPKARIISGTDVVKILGKSGFSIFTQRGSHMKLRRKIGDQEKTLTVPNHKELEKGTVHGIFTQASQFIPENEIRKYFYTE